MRNEPQIFPSFEGYPPKYRPSISKVSSQYHLGISRLMESADSLVIVLLKLVNMCSCLLGDHTCRGVILLHSGRGHGTPCVGPWIEPMAVGGRRRIRLCEGTVGAGAAALFLLLVSFGAVGLCAAELRNCSFPAVYSFGDSLTDNGNAIAALPEQFIDSEGNPNGVNFPHHAADRYCDGRLLVDYIAFGVRRKPNYAILRSIAADFTYGANFAFAGATARNNTEFRQMSGFNSPFSLNLQVSWLERYKVRLQFYYEQIAVNQSLPSVDSLNSSLYFVNAGFQDYFFPLYYKNLTASETLDLVDSVVDAIIKAVQRIFAFGARTFMIVNLPPLGCLPALLALYPEKDSGRYDAYGCLDALNNISKTHNALLESRVSDLRTTYTNATFYLADYYNVYRDVLKSPADYGIAETLTACCGYGGSYNFDSGLFCTHSGVVNGSSVNLVYPCLNSTAYINWDGIHPSEQMNWIAATAFFNGDHIKPVGGFNCLADYSNWYN